MGLTGIAWKIGGEEVNGQRREPGEGGRGYREEGISTINMLMLTTMLD